MTTSYQRVTTTTLAFRTRVSANHSNDPVQVKTITITKILERVATQAKADNSQPQEDKRTLLEELGLHSEEAAAALEEVEVASAEATPDEEASEAAAVSAPLAVKTTVAEAEASVEVAADLAQANAEEDRTVIHTETPAPAEAVA